MGSPRLLAHRGLAQTFEIEGLKWDSNTASMIHTPEHSFIENTIPSMEAAFACGADIVEFDVRLTKDHKLVVFHDFLLEYRTNGKGLVSSATIAELRKLDVGYGYTADGGRTYPFRGKGIGLMVTADDVLKTFPDKSFLIHIKDGEETSGKLLVSLFKGKSLQWLDSIGVYGDHKAIVIIKDAFPKLKVLSKKTLKDALIPYLFLGWTGYIPKSLRDTQIYIPLKYAKYLWGWPRKFLDRMDAVDTRVTLVNGSGKWSEGFDTENDLNLIPKDFNGYIWTNRIDLVSISERFKQR